VFIAATLPREGGKSVAADLAKRFPDLVWLQGRQLHLSKSGVTHSWVPLQREADAAPAVVAALRDDAVEAQGRGVSMVFCRDAAAADALHADLVAVRRLPESLNHLP
jgi:hypothetical protein